tara:strand:+ start:7378 stop:9384 length:2007 start_codon:yes stop_codon:yes gene_type:complete
MANYYVEYTPITITANETWGNNDVDGGGTIDGGNTPLNMTLYANDGWYVDNSMFTIKGYEPTSIGIDGERIWEHNFPTTDASGSSVTTNLNNFTKIEMSDSVVSNITWPDCGSCGLAGMELFDGNVANAAQLYLSTLSTPNFLINGSPIEDGDLLGAFYEENGQYICSGILAWDTSDTGQILTIYGQNSNNEGFPENATIYLFVKDISTELIYPVPNFIPNASGVYSNWNDGFTGPASLGYSWYGLAAGQTINADTVYTPVILDNYINVKAWLHPDYQVGYNDVELTLDIDGDADVAPPVQAANEFYVELKLGDGAISNCEIIANLDYLSSPGIFDTNTNNPTWFAEVFDDGDETSAAIKFTKNASYGDQSTSLNTSLPGESGNDDFNDISFIIIPKQGYAVSRSNFWIETVGDWTSNQYSEWNDDGIINSVGPSIDQPRYDTTGNTSIYHALYYNNITTNVENNLVTYLAQEYGAISNGEDGCFDCWRVVDYVTNPKVALEDSFGINYYNLYDIQDAVPGGACVNAFPNGRPTGACSAIKIWDGIWWPGCQLDDDSCDYGDWVNYQTLFNCSDYGNCDEIYPWTHENNPMNNNLNPSNYSNNVVIVTLRMLSNYNPQINTQAGTYIPKNMVFTINGSAMEVPIGSTVDTSFNVTVAEFSSGMSLLSM